jgi:hypothetical protein
MSSPRFYSAADKVAAAYSDPEIGPRTREYIAEAVRNARAIGGACLVDIANGSTRAGLTAAVAASYANSALDMIEEARS